MERSCSPGSKGTAGVLRVSTDCKQGRCIKSTGPRTVSIAVTKPSLFGKRPPPRTPSMTVKHRAQGMERHPDSSETAHCTSGDTKALPLSNVAQARLHPIFAALSQDVQDHPRAVSLPDAEEALSAVCISRLGSSPAAGLRSLPSTPLGTGYSCSGNLEFLHGPNIDTAELDVNRVHHAPSKTMVIKNTSCVNPFAVRRLLQQPTLAKTIEHTMCASDPAQTNQARGPSVTLQQHGHLCEDSMPCGTSGHPLPPTFHSGVSTGSESKHVDRSAVQHEASVQSTDAATDVDMGGHDVGLCIVPSCSSR